MLTIKNMSVVSGKRTGKLHPQKFMLWLTIASIIMMFAGLTSAYIVRKAQGNWTEFYLPQMFFVSTGIIVGSSVTLYWAYRGFKDYDIDTYRKGIGWTFLLGVAFAVCQYLGWQQMSASGILLTGNPSGAFIYLLTGIHAVHVLVGVLLLAIFYIKSRRISDIRDVIANSGPYRSLGIELLSTYWHFVGILWIYLLLFFLYI